MKREAKGAAVPDPKTKVKEPHARGIAKHVPTAKSQKKVKLLAGLGFTQEEIALLLDIGESTLIKAYRHELRVGGLEADAQVLGNLFRLATQTKDLNVASRNSIFWAKVRRRWHEVQRVIHGYDPETIKSFVKQVIAVLRRELPDSCPGCKTKLNLGPNIATKLLEMSSAMAAKLPESEIIAAPRPELAGDRLSPHEENDD